MGQTWLRMTTNVAQHRIVNLLKTLWDSFLWLCVSMYLMCGPRQLFFQCGPETPKAWTPPLRFCCTDALPPLHLFHYFWSYCIRLLHYHLSCICSFSETSSICSKDDTFVMRLGYAVSIAQNLYFNINTINFHSVGKQMFISLCAFNINFSLHFLCLSDAIFPSTNPRVVCAQHVAAKICKGLFLCCSLPCQM